ncbi:unnamed protein product [Bemisia tabaci]|uniref:Carboxylesterase type B domain-containing protein n=1 Tax=Bemisia tabaci TaxID=7038 RepID=A0A9P0G1M9_BEMTA|nr:unnamed protein product [Bemisia tabaci]
MTIKLIVQYGTVFLVLSVLCEHFFCKIVEINTKSGKILGTTVRARDGRCIRCFRGIPYAQPPVGDLRFKAPVPVNNSYAILNATADAPPCPQINPSNKMVIGEENCLYLNVYTPQAEVSGQRCPGRYTRSGPRLVSGLPGAGLENPPGARRIWGHWIHGSGSPSIQCGRKQIFTSV